MSTILSSALRPGDVLLYHGDSFLSKLIRMFDGTEYSHAGIYNGTHVVEALGGGITTNTLEVSKSGARFVDVYRFRNSDGKFLGDAGFPAQPVVERIAHYQENPERYAYEQLLLLAVLASTRRVKVPGLSLVLRKLLDSAADVLTRLAARGRQPMICSEFVFRCYAEAGDGYRLLIRGSDLAGALGSVLAAAPGDAADGLDGSPEVARFLELYAAAVPPGSGELGAGPAGATLGARANFVTPGDLKNSPSLRKLGTLEVQTNPVFALGFGAPRPGNGIPDGHVLTGDGSFGFVARVEGEDLVVENVKCTWFGGADDPMDNGETASGVNTKDNPSLRGCALPMDLSPRYFPATDGSPLPKLPWRTQVEVTNRANGAQLTVPLIDLGPSKFAASRAAIDLTPTAFTSIGGTISGGVLRVDFRVKGGARHVGGGVLGGSLASSLKSALRQAPPAGEELGASVSTHAAAHGTSNPHAKPALRRFIQSPNRSSRNGADIDRIVVHFTDGASAQSAINTFLDDGPDSRQTSAHYIIDRNGDLYQMVQDSDRAHHCKGANQKSIGIEHVATKGQPLSPAQEVTSVALIRWLITEYHIPLANITGHRWTPGYAGGTGGTDCPHSLFGTAGQQQPIHDWVHRHFGALGGASPSGVSSKKKSARRGSRLG